VDRLKLSPPLTLKKVHQKPSDEKAGYVTTAWPLKNLVLLKTVTQKFPELR
jgi:hypothetical protein